MKKRAKLICILSVLLVLTLTITACGYQSDHITVLSTNPPEQKQLTIYTSLPEVIYLPIVREFENRTGIWAEVETGNTISKLESVASGEPNEADLLFGCQPDVIEQYKGLFTHYDSLNGSMISETYSSADGLWQPFAVNRLVAIYNSKLLSEYQPNSWKGIFLSGWNKQVAYVSPEKSDVGFVTLRTVANALDISGDEVLSMLVPELEYDTCERVLEAVVRGQCYFGIVTEDVAIRAIVDGSDIDVIYPKEGDYQYPCATAIFGACAHEANAQRFVDFIQEKNVQEYLGDNFAMHTIYKQIAPEDHGVARQKAEEQSEEVKQ